jgi:hypothetical protein
VGDAEQRFAVDLLIDERVDDRAAPGSIGVAPDALQRADVGKARGAESR